MPPFILTINQSFVCPLVCLSVHSSVCLTINLNVIPSVQLSVWSSLRSIPGVYCLLVTVAVWVDFTIHYSIPTGKILIRLQPGACNQVQ